MESRETVYSEDHEWFRLEGELCVMGITDFAQDELGEVVFVELPEVGQSFEKDAEVGSIESVKAVSEVYTAVAGDVVEVNEALEETPELVNQDAEGEGWLLKLSPASPVDLEKLMSAEAYAEFTRSG